MRCLNCGRDFTPTRSDQMFCRKRCRDKYWYIPAPKCSECSSQKTCGVANTKKKYAPKECPQRA